MKKIVYIATVCIMAIMLLISNSVTAADKISYCWQNVTIGGGGFMTGYVFHPQDTSIRYARGDVGGAWRWDEAQQKWVSMSNKFNYLQRNFYGCDGIAVDPLNVDVVYMAVGKSQWLPGTVLKSTDRGKSWIDTGLNKSFASNSNYRFAGECIAVDPVNSNIILAGTLNSGLYISTDGAASWNTVSIEGITDYTDYPIRCILFDKSSSGSEKTFRIYISVIGKGLYVTQDGGNSWSAVTKSPSEIYRMDIADNGTLYIASADGLMRYKNGSLTDCSYVPADYRAVAVDHSNENFIVAVYSGINVMKYPVIYSTDGGENWVNATSNITKIKNTGYLEDDNFSSNTSFLSINPDNCKNVVFGDWFGLWETEDITGNNGADKVIWEDNNLGIEQTCALRCVSHPENKYITLMTVCDNDGFPVTDLDAMQSRKFNNRGLVYGGERIMTTSDIDICEDNSEYVVRVGVNHNRGSRSGYSTDGGNTWNKFSTDPLTINDSGVNVWSKARFSSNVNQLTGKPDSLVVIKSGEIPRVSHDMGESWKEITTLPIIDLAYQSTTEILDKDYVADNTFYCYGGNGYFYRSTDGGDTWHRRCELDALGNYKLKAAPGMKDEVWFLNYADSNGVLYRSSDGLRTLNQINNINGVIAFGFGKEAPGKNNPTVYAYGTVNGRLGIYRSVDMGTTWRQIDDDSLPIGNDPANIDGSRKEFGLVFVTTGGSGVFYGTAPEDDPDNTNTLFPYDEELDVTVEGANVTITGNVRGGSDGEKVSLLVYNPGYSSEDWGTAEAIQNQQECYLLNGRFTFEFTLNFESLPQGKCNFEFNINSPSLTQPYKSKFSFVPENTEFQAVVHDNRVTINGYVSNGIAYEHCSILVLNPGYDLSDWGKDNAVQFQGEVTLDADCNFTVDFPLNYSFIENKDLYQALYFNVYCCGTTTAKGGFYVSDNASSDERVYQGIAYCTLDGDDAKLYISKDGLVLPEGEITVHIPVSSEGTVSKTVLVYYAIYDNDKNMLLSLNTMEKEVFNNQGWVEYASKITAEKNQVVKCYVWEHTLKPALYTLD